MVVVAQLVRVLVCGAEGRRFEPGQPPKTQKLRRNSRLFLWFSDSETAIDFNIYKTNKELSFNTLK